MGTKKSIELYKKDQKQNDRNCTNILNTVMFPSKKSPFFTNFFCQIHTRTSVGTDLHIRFDAVW
jgi:hypothetical protein